MKRDTALVVATVFGVGYAPFAPGTFGSAAGLALCAVLPSSVLVQSLTILSVFAVGQGLTLFDHPAIKVKNCSPRLLAALAGTAGVTRAPAAHSLDM